jgi:hypothetical protein
MELYIIEGLSVSYLIMWLLGVPLSVILLAWFAGISR